MTNSTKEISVVIPTHGMKNGEYFFRRCLDSLWNQSFQDFDIVVTDNSDDDKIERICEWYRTGIHYYRNPRKGMAQNTNEGINRATGRLIKILYMDDYMAHNKALENIHRHFKGEWLVTGCAHSRDGIEKIRPHFPEYNSDIHIINTIGSPSVLTIKNDVPLLFDEELTWLLDADLYKRYHEAYGNPTILEEINVIIGIGQHQMTYELTDERKLQEEVYVKTKHE